MRVHYTRFLCLIYAGLCYTLISAQYVYTPCALVYGPEAQGFSDSVVCVAGNESVSFERTRYCDFGMLYDYAGELLDQKDSLPDAVVHHLHKLLYPYFGQWTQTHLQILSLRMYNTYEPDSEEIANNPYCKNIKFEYTCQLIFNSYIQFPFLLQLDAKGNILNKKDIPLGISAFQKMELISPCEIFNKAKADVFFNGHLPWHLMELRYSNKVGILYYIVESSSSFSTDYYDYDLGGEQKSQTKHIFYNALSGKVVWQTEAIRTMEIGRDFTHESIGFKSNPFFNE